MRLGSSDDVDSREAGGSVGQDFWRSGFCPLELATIRRDFRSMEGAFLSGQMLIAMPGIGDPRFERSLILICAHAAEHAMGIAVNRPVEGLTVPELMQRLEIETTAELDDDAVLIGGPVEVERGFVLHTADYHA